MHKIALMVSNLCTLGGTERVTANLNQALSKWYECHVITLWNDGTYAYQLATIVGLIDYPYYDLILNGPADQIEKLPKVMSFLQAHGIHVEQKHFMQVWLIAREIKGVLLEAFWCLGGAYLVYAWYKDEWSQALRLAVRAVTCSCCVLFVYAIAEVLYLAGNETAKEILSFINPYIHPIVTNHG